MPALSACVSCRQGEAGSTLHPLLCCSQMCPDSRFSLSVTANPAPTAAASPTVFRYCKGGGAHIAPFDVYQGVSYGSSCQQRTGLLPDALSKSMSAQALPQDQVTSVCIVGVSLWLWSSEIQCCAVVGLKAFMVLGGAWLRRLVGKQANRL